MSIHSVGVRQVSSDINSGREPKRLLPALTGIRAFAAIWVVGYHLLPQVQTLAPNWLYKLYHSFMSTGYLGVDLFFILSGFIISLNYAGRLTKGFNVTTFANFIWLRIARIYPVHIFCLLLLVPAILLMRCLGIEVDQDRFSVESFFTNLLMIHAWRPDVILNLTWNTPAWSISCEWLAYLLFPLLAYLALLSKNTRVTAILGFTSLFYVPILIYILGKMTTFGYMDHFIRIAFEFLGGILIFKCFSAKFGDKINWNLVLSITLVVIYLGTNLANFLGYEYQAYFLVPLMGIVIYSLAWSESGWSNFFSRKSVIYWGAVSYSLYMVHNLWLMVTKAVLPAENFAQSGYFIKLGIFMIYLLPLFLLAGLTYRVVEEPARRWLSRLSTVRQLSSAAAKREETRDVL